MKIQLHNVLLICATALVVPATPVWAKRSSFDHYQVILDRKPFGVLPEKPVVSDDALLPPPEPEVDPHAPPPGAFIEKLRICAMTETDFGLRVGIVDISTKPEAVYFLYPGEVESGIEVVEANYAEESVLLRKGAEAYWLDMNVDPVGGGAAKPAKMSSTALAAPKADDSSRLSYSERLHRRRELEAQRLEDLNRPVQITGEELEKHLQKMQMEAIRTGAPPLPIPLTQEMDDQLVKEGVLPPQE